jgi:hypothetical protein
MLSSLLSAVVAALTPHSVQDCIVRRLRPNRSRFRECASADQRHEIDRKSNLHFLDLCGVLRANCAPVYREKYSESAQPHWRGAQVD